MGTLIPIQSVSADDVQRVVKDALRGKLDTDLIQDFLASVDWSGVLTERPPIADMLGELENRTTMYDEGDTPVAEYVAFLEALLPASARSA